MLKRIFKPEQQQHLWRTLQAVVLSHLLPWLPHILKKKIIMLLGWDKELICRGIFHLSILLVFYFFLVFKQYSLPFFSLGESTDFLPFSNNLEKKRKNLLGSPVQLVHIHITHSVSQGNQNIIQYIILKDEILRFNFCHITSKQGVYSTVHSLGSRRSNGQWDYWGKY